VNEGVATGLTAGDSSIQVGNTQIIIGTNSTANVDINGTIFETGGNVMATALGTAPATVANNDPGTPGQIVVDADYIYVCTATDTWKRVALSTY
jgi:hypothetical protein